MKKLLLLPGLILGIAVFWYMSQSRIGPGKTQTQERAKPVRIIPAPKVLLIPIAVGNGYVQPERKFQPLQPEGQPLVQKIKIHYNRNIDANETGSHFKIRESTKPLTPHKEPKS